MDNSVKIFIILALICFSTYGLFDGLTTVRTLSEPRSQVSEINLNFALFAAGEGYRVVPLDRNNSPYIQKGLPDQGWDSATTNPGLIESWWKQWPDAAVGFTDGTQRSVIRFDVALTESSDVLRFALEHYGIYGLLAAKLIITGCLITGCILAWWIYRRIIWVGIMILLAFSLIGLIAGLSNADYFTFAMILEQYGIGYGNLYGTILVACFITGIVITAVSFCRDARTITGSEETAGESDSDSYARAKYYH